ncbi:hypothetical protein Taro_001107 [Colocasia esculenta]|uniref:Uncharacterized protein n=1 Tax=Colocasia esculenta TaxID=4460 RepID=A0A843TCL7_COLES|nr:hypothetical protein [Colocasia esculenta]
MSSDVDTLTPLLELYIRLRERRHALVVGGTDTSSRHWSPASPFPVPHSSEPRPGSLEVSGMGLRPCGPQVRVRRTFLDRRPVQSRVVAVQGKYLQLYSSSSSSVV